MLAPDCPVSFTSRRLLTVDGTIAHFFGGTLRVAARGRNVLSSRTMRFVAALERASRV